MDMLNRLTPDPLSLSPSLDAYHNVLILDLERRLRLKSEARRASNAIVVSLLKRNDADRQWLAERVALGALEAEFGLEERS